MSVARARASLRLAFLQEAEQSTRYRPRRAMRWQCGPTVDFRHHAPSTDRFRSSDATPLRQLPQAKDDRAADSWPAPWTGCEQDLFLCCNFAAQKRSLMRFVLLTRLLHANRWPVRLKTLWLTLLP